MFDYTAIKSLLQEMFDVICGQNVVVPTLLQTSKQKICVATKVMSLAALYTW